MKKLLLLFVFISISFSIQAQMRSYADPRIELSCIAWRIAGAEEYCKHLYAPYEKDITVYFSKYDKHPLMDFIRSMREDPYNVAYNGVPDAAELLVIDNGGIKLNPKLNIETFTSTIDSRWTVENLKRYTVLLDDFYRRTKFDKFYKEHQSLYDRYVVAMDSLMSKYIDTTWFEKFYGVKFPELSVCISPACGYNNYASGDSFHSYLGKPGIGAVIGGCSDLPEAIANDMAISAILLHEISHSFSNPIFAPYFNNEFLKQGEKIFPVIPNSLTRAGYGSPRIVTGEFLNELFTMMYIKDVLNTTISRNLLSCEAKGFIWARQAVPFMDNFYANRNMFPTIKEFMPQLIGFMDKVADNIETILKEYNARPYVVSTFPAQESYVSSDLKEVRVRYSRPMATHITAFVPLKIDGVNPIYIDNEEAENEEDDEGYWVDDYTFAYKINVPLQPGKRYGVRVDGRYTRCAGSQMPIGEDYIIIFNIKN